MIYDSFIVQPALLTLKQQCADTANRQNSEKIKVKEQLEQVRFTN
jgi:hypothetical protein